MMNFDQGELDFSGDGTEQGYRKWQRDLDERKRAFELRYGVIVGRRVRVQLIGETHPLEGLIRLDTEKPPQAAAKLRLRLGAREFTAAQIESIIRIDEPDEG